MICPYCECEESEVKFVIKIRKQMAVVRRRMCINCKARYNTLETYKPSRYDKKQFITKSA